MANDLLKTDLKLTSRDFDQMTSDREFVDLKATLRDDLQTVNGRENLAQAIINRLLTRRGELTHFGHPNYGSRLYLLIGELNNIKQRAKAELYIRECLTQEPRIEVVKEVSFAKPNRQEDRSTLKVRIRLKPIGGGDEFSIVIPLDV